MKNKIIELIYDAIDEVNQMNDLELNKTPDTTLFGRDSDLDSLGLVNLIISVEESVNEAFDTIISLADEKAMSQKHSPFRSIDTLADYIVILLNEEKQDD